MLFPIEDILSTDEMLRYNQDNNDRAKAFCFVTYGNPCTLLDNLSNVVNACTIYHNLDTKPHSLEKVIPHYHVLVIFKSQRYLSAMRKLCKSLSEKLDYNTFVECVHSIAKASLYMLHQDDASLSDPNKHTYVFDDLICDNPAFWNKIIKGNDTVYNEELVRDIIYLTPLEMAYKYGKDYIRNVERYDKFRKHILDIYDGDLPSLLDDVSSELTDPVKFKNKISNHYVYERGSNNE